MSTYIFKSYYTRDATGVPKDSLYKIAKHIHKYVPDSVRGSDEWILKRSAHARYV